MKKLGLIGHPVSHSKSPDFFKAKLASISRSDVVYKAYDIESINDLKKLLGDEPEIMGLNVTIPHKVDVLNWVDELDEVAQEIGAVNTLVRNESGWKGFNTDAWGFSRSLKPFIKGRHERALILGSGGASKAVQYSLNKLGIETVVVSRRASEGRVEYGELTAEALRHYLLIVNCTPLGTHPYIEGCVDIPWDGVGEKHLMVDLVYNPEETTFMKRAIERGATAMNGADMLRLQAERSLDIWLEHGL